MGFSSECCEYVLLALVNKDTVLAYGRVEFSKVGNPGRDRGGKKMESGRRHVATERGRCQNLTSRPQPHGDTQIDRNGLI